MIGPDSNLARLNEAATRELEAEAQLSRDRLLQLSGIVLRELLETQALDASLAASGENFEYWVTGSDVHVPSIIGEPDEPSDCLSFMLQGYNFFQSREERLRILIPVDRSFDQDSIPSIENLPNPDAIFAERLLPASEQGKPGEVISRYAVTRERAYPFIYDGSDIIEDIDDGSIIEFFKHRIPDEMTRVVRLRLDMVRFKAIPQSRTVIGEASVEDL